MLHDLRLAWHNLTRQPAFTALVVGILGTAIAANTAIFGLIDAALLRTLPFDEPGRLVMGQATFGGRVNPWVSGYDYYDYREQSRTLESFASLGGGASRVTVLGGPEPELVEAAFVSWDLFQTLRVRPSAGRLFTEEDAVAGRADVVMISHDFWQRRFGGAPGAVESTLSIDGRPRPVIGVLPAGFHFLYRADVWGLTYRDGPLASARRWHNLLLVGRLKPGVSIEEAQSEIDVISARLEAEYPDTNDGKGLLLTGLHDALAEGVRDSLLMLMAAVGLLLLMACGNVAGLLLARGQTRASDLAVRAALGASRLRLVRELLTESVVLGLLAGVAGIGLAFVFEDLAIALLPVHRLGITGTTLGHGALLFALGLALATGVIFGTLPALRESVVEPSHHLRAGSRSTESRGGVRLRRALVVAQVAICFVLLTGAGLLIRSYSRQMSVDLGFDPASLLAGQIRLGADAYPEPDARIAFFSTFLARARALPGATSVGLIDRLPIRQPAGNIYIRRPDQPATAKMELSADFRVADPGYLRTMRIPLLAGRDLAETDTATTPRVMIVSASLANLVFPGQNPIGQRLVVDMGDPVEHEVVGVAGDARLRHVRNRPFHAMYMPYRQYPRPVMHVAIRTTGDPTLLVSPLRALLREMDPNIPFAEPATMQGIVDDAVADTRVVTVSLAVFSGLALLVALLGIYAVLAYHVSQRAHELSVRLALGATPAGLLRQVVGQGFVLVGIGLVLGGAGALAGAGVLDRLLFDTAPKDPATFAAVTTFLLLTSLIACLLSARRVTHLNPVDALQAE